MDHKLIRIGRAAQNDWVFSNPEVSGEHAQLFQDSDGFFFLTDLNSKAGVFVNGTRIQGAVQIKVGDKVNLSGTVPLDWERRLGLDNEAFEKTIVGTGGVEVNRSKSKLIPVLSIFLLLVSFGVILYFITKNKTEVLIQFERGDESGKQISQFDFDALNKEDLVNYIGYALIESEKTNSYIHPSGSQVILTDDMIIVEIKQPKERQQNAEREGNNNRREEGNGGQGKKTKQEEKGAQETGLNPEEIKVITEDQTYTVKKGDSIDSIVEKYRLKGCNTSKNKVLEANPSIVDPEKIKEGKKILIPC